MWTLALDGTNLTLAAVARVWRGESVRIRPTRGAWARVRAAEAVVRRCLARDEAVYGVNTGFGKLATTRIPADKLDLLQRNLIVSHAAGVGEPLPTSETRLVLLFRIQALLHGCSGVSPGLIEALAGLLERDVLPVIPSQGSVGASGDLAPLAHVGLALLGEGDAWFRGRHMQAATALRKAGLRPYRFRPKEGLSLINGTQAICAILGGVLCRLETLLPTADVVAAMTVEAMTGSVRPFDRRVQECRPHPGQARVAANVRSLLRGSRILLSHKNCGKVQDPYSLRCTPQVHGAVRDAYFHALSVFTIEINSAVDNPLVFSESAELISAGNFHGQPVAQAADHLTVALTTLGNISERRVEKLTNAGASGLPPFLVKESGLNSGFMLPQVVAAALAAENRARAYPASVTSIPTSAEQEDHVSMGTIAARTARDVTENTERIVAIEALCAAQGLDFLRPLVPGRGALAAWKAVRSAVPTLTKDRYMKPDLDRAAHLVRSGALLSAARAAAGPIR